MRFDKFTIKSQEALNEAQSAAERNGNQEVTVEHLLLALIGQEGGIVSPLLKKVGANVGLIKEQITQGLGRLPKVKGGDLYLAQGLRDCLNASFDEARTLKDDFVSTEHILLAAVKAGGETAKILAAQGVDREALLKAMTSIRGSRKVTDQMPEEKYQAVAKYTRDLVEQARRGKLDPVIGRDDEIRRVV